MREDDANALQVTVEEIRKFRKELLLMHGLLAEEMVQEHSILNQVAHRFHRKGLDRLWLDRELAPFMGTEMAEDALLLESYILDTLESMIVCRVDESPKQRACLLLGPTGVGKTTLIAKIAARYAYLVDPPTNVAICNLDQDKLGAQEQLQHYSEAMDIPLVTENDWQKDADLVYDLLLLDSAGIHPKRLDGLYGVIEKMKKSDYSLEVSLVLSAGMRESDMVYLMDQLNAFSIESFMITKLDETENISDMIRFLMDHPKPVRYLSVGQEIPEDLMVANAGYLVEKFMNRRDNNG